MDWATEDMSSSSPHVSIGWRGLRSLALAKNLCRRHWLDPRCPPGRGRQGVGKARLGVAECRGPGQVPPRPFAAPAARRTAWPTHRARCGFSSSCPPSWASTCNVGGNDDVPEHPALHCRHANHPLVTKVAAGARRCRSGRGGGHEGELGRCPKPAHGGAVGSEMRPPACVAAYSANAASLKSPAIQRCPPSGRREMPAAPCVAQGREGRDIALAATARWLLPNPAARAKSLPWTAYRLK